MRSLVSLLLLVFTASASLQAATRLVVVSDPPAKDLAWAPLSFRLQGVPDLPGVRVRRVSDGKDLPAQIERIKGGVIVHWVSPALKAGKKGGWLIELLGKASGGKDRVKVLTQGTGASRLDIDG